MSDDLVTFLRARLDEDEQIARAAFWDEQSDVWTARPPRASYERYTVVDYLDDGVVAVTPENADADGVGQHIARHDPARVLAEVDAKRRILHWHLDEECCSVCLDDVEGCPLFRALAAPYADHPDYREAWRP
ncbi:DUF6221 family protein [Streptomyces hygroscopicus]|uniref:DUF6221 family protein n=1 Tax=Streptomyces hygroscopicus TaxID=1912 RepID=UPI0007C66165|nr:DUF6221 family protein [Streptomyces hygroscopicus]